MNNNKSNFNENEEYLTSQIITYIGNKRSLLSFIGEALDIVKSRLKKEKLYTVDLFSGSGIVARYLKQHSSKIIANDLEDYSYVLNKCYLSNKEDLNMDELISWYNYLKENLNSGLGEGIISEMYAPKDINNIKEGEKRYNDKEHGGFAPVSMYFREEEWTVEEMFDIMKEIAEYSFRYWLY